MARQAKEQTLVAMVAGIIATLIALLVPVFSLSLGLGRPRGALLTALRDPIVVRTVPVALLGVPMAAIAVVTLLPVAPVVRALILLVSICPGMIFLGMSERKDPRRAPIASATAIVLTVAGVVTLPLALRLLGHLFPAHFRVASGAVLARIVLPVLLPFVLGAVLKADLPWTTTTRLRAIADIVFTVTLGCALLALLVIGTKGLAELRLVDAVAMISFVVLSAMVGNLAGGADPADRSFAANAAVMGNPALAMLVAATSYPNVKVLPTMAALVVLRFVGLALYRRLVLRLATRPSRVRRHAA